MNSFSLAFSVVCPLFLLLALGYFLRYKGLFTEDFVRQLNSVCFEAFFPAILFINVYDSDFSTSFQPGLVLFSLLCVLVLFAILMLVVPKLETDNRRRGVMIQGMFRSNFILFGLPMTISLFGPSQTGTTAIVVAFVIPLFNLLAVVTLEYFRGGKVSLRRILVGVITNPLIVGALAAFVFVLSGIRLPRVLLQTVRDISKIATPLALIILGGSFTFSRLRPNLKRLVAVLGAKLILIPLCFLGLSIAIGYRGVELGTLLALFASPTAVSSFTMAQQMQADDELAGQIVVVGSLCAIVTIFFWISMLSEFGFLQPLQ
ncbi:MAG: AEC family transporter [Oscillospiraceae bacterium]